MTEDEPEDPLITPLVKVLTRAAYADGRAVHVFHVQRRRLERLLPGVAQPVYAAGRDPAASSASWMTLRDDRIFEILFVKSAKCPLAFARVLGRRQLRGMR